MSGRGRKDERVQEIRASEKAEYERTHKSESEIDTAAFVSAHFPNWLNLKAVCSRDAAHVTTCNSLSLPSSNRNKNEGKRGGEGKPRQATELLFTLTRRDSDPLSQHALVCCIHRAKFSQVSITFPLSARKQDVNKGK